jgi:hypothetical protein
VKMFIIIIPTLEEEPEANAICQKDWW